MLPARAATEDPKNSLIERLTQYVLHRIQQGTVALPSMPVAAFDCLELLRRSDFSMRDAARVIEQDPALAARVLAVSNSAVFGRREKARNVLQAVTRLGASNLRVVLFEAMAIPIFESNDSRIRQACATLWKHARAVAACARQATLLVGAGDPGEAYLSGLLHDIGKPVVATLLVQAERRIIGSPVDFWLEPDLWLDVLQGAHRPVGTALAQRWKLPESVVGAVENCTTYDEANPCTIINCVRLANALAKEVGVYVGRVDEAEIAAIVEVGQSLLGLGEKEIAELRFALCDAPR